MDELVNVKRTANAHAVGRCAAISRSNRFKVNQTVLKEEIAVACMFGELSALERILIFIQQNPNLPREELEGAMHLSIVAINNEIAEKIDRKDAKIKVDDYLELRGYHDKPSPLGTQLEELRQ